MLFEAQQMVEAGVFLVLVIMDSVCGSLLRCAANFFKSGLETLIFCVLLGTHSSVECFNVMCLPVISVG